MTERLYETDSYLKSFKATVLSSTETNGEYWVQLDKTAFFPEGGGQASDEGTIGGAAVSFVKREGNIILHKTEKPLTVGAEVLGEIDWELRYSRMQSHTAEHILSGVVHSLFGFDNIGFHMGERVMSVDFSGSLSKGDIERVESESNKAIFKNVPITAFYPAGEELETLEYRSKIELGDDTRIVKIGDIDCCACCAPHLNSSGEAGIIKVIDFYPNKQGTRVEMLAGVTALMDYAALNADNKKLMALYKAPRDGVLAAAEKAAEDLKNLRAENQNLARRLALYELKREEIGGNLLAYGENLSFDEMRYCANSLNDSYSLCVLLSKAEDGYMYVLCSKEGDVRPLVSELNRAFEGKGGGKNDYAQGKLAANEPETLREFVLNLLGGE